MAHAAVAGRDEEKRLLDAFLGSGQPELLAIYGRRRVGKTHLIREYCAPRGQVFFCVTGQKGASKATQLFHFRNELSRTFHGGVPLPQLHNWEEALDALAGAVEQLDSRVKKPLVLFFDELPWLATPRSSLLPALEHCWNTRLSRLSSVRVVVCGSAASWMLSKVIHARGGLHNRLTRRIHLLPFTLGEAAEYLRWRGVMLKRSQVLELYMALGGVPYYLSHVARGRSATQNIAAICFGQSGPLHDEYGRLFASLFDNAEIYDKIVRAVARSRKGLTRDEMLHAVGMSSGGRVAQRLRELEEAGFTASLTPIGRRSKDTVTRLIDEYVTFYLKWIERAPRGVLARGATTYWQSKAGTPAYRAWSGVSFEMLCLKHADRIRQALGIEGVSSEVGTWRCVPGKNERSSDGAQVDLLFDRADGVINLCELKYSQDQFVIDKACARELKRKVEVFEQRTKTKKQVFLTLVTTHGLKANAWSEGLVSSVVTADALF